MDDHVVTRRVPHPRMVDGFSPSERTRALEELLRHHDPAVVQATTMALYAARSVLQAEVRHG